MNNTQFKHRPIKVNILFLFLCFVSMILLSHTILAQKKTESKVENKVPKHLPIKVELINGDKEDILKDLEIKVTNTGDKPIYYLYFVLSTLDVKAYGSPIGYLFTLGNSELTDPLKFANLTDDESLKPKESHIFKLSSKYAENAKSKQGLWEFTPYPQKFILEFQFLSFGDGSGFTNTSGRAYPIKQKANSVFQNKIPDKEQVFPKSTLSISNLLINEESCSN